MIVSTPGFFLRRYLARWFIELSNATQKYKRERPGAELSYDLRRGYFKKPRNYHMICSVAISKSSGMIMCAATYVATLFSAIFELIITCGCVMIALL